VIVLIACLLNGLSAMQIGCRQFVAAACVFVKTGHHVGL
jgi:hypothetical protein